MEEERSFKDSAKSNEQGPKRMMQQRQRCAGMVESIRPIHIQQCRTPTTIS